MIILSDQYWNNVNYNCLKTCQIIIQLVINDIIKHKGDFFGHIINLALVYILNTGI